MCLDRWVSDDAGFRLLKVNHHHLLGLSPPNMVDQEESLDYKIGEMHGHTRNEEPSG